MAFIKITKAISPDSKQPIPDTAELSGDNGVAMPGPMDGGRKDEAGWNQNGFGADMRGVAGYQGYVVGVQLPGGASRDEADQDFNHFGEDMSGLAPRQDAPPTNQDFGVEGGMTPAADEDDEHDTRVFGTVGSNTDGVLTSDILRVFGAVADSRGMGVSGHEGAGFDSMRGIPLGPGSGTLGMGVGQDGFGNGGGMPGRFEFPDVTRSLESATDE